MSKSDNGLLQEITTLMTDAQQAADDKKISKVMQKIRDMDIDKSSDQLRLAACHFMTMYHTRKAMTIGMPQQQADMNPFGAASAMAPPQTPELDFEAVEKFKKAQREDMELGWRLLNIRGGNSQAARTARVLKIEVAQRLEDSAKLQEAFGDLMKRNLTDEEIMVAFTAAPFLGDWKAMMKLGTKIERMPGGLEQLHMMSLQLPIPDFTLIYQLAKEYSLQRQKKPSVDSLQWDLFNVEKIRVKFKDVDCGKFKENRKELLAEIQKQGDVEWEDVPNCSHVHIKRMGALCQAVSFGEIPMMLNGPWFDDKIHVRGRAEMPLMPEGAGANPFGGGMPSPDQITILVQEEEWIIRRDKKNPLLYKGTYILKQRPELPPGKKITKEHAPVNMTFDCEIFIKETDGNTSGAPHALTNGNRSDEKEDKVDDDENEAIEEHQDDDIEVQNTPEDEALVTEFDGLELD